MPDHPGSEICSKARVWCPLFGSRFVDAATNPKPNRPTHAPSARLRVSAFWNDPGSSSVLGKGRTQVNLNMPVIPPSQPVPADVDMPVAPLARDEQSTAAAVSKTTPVQMVCVSLGAMAFLYFARPVVLPVFLAWVVGMAL